MLSTQNRLLALLPDVVRRRWEPHLKLVELRKGDCIDLNKRHHGLYFPVSCVVAMSMGTTDSARVFLRFTGTSFVVGLVNLLKVSPMEFFGTVCGSGYALRLDSQFFMDQLPKNFLGEDPRATAMARIAKNGVQVAHCAKVHPTSQRLAQMLIQAHDCFGPNQWITLTQQEICDWLGVRRETVTHLLGEWSAFGLLHTGRGHLDIVDATSLRSQACSCLADAKRFYTEEELFWRNIRWPDPDQTRPRSKG